MKERPQVYRTSLVEMFPGERYGRFLVIEYSPKYEYDAHVEWHTPYGRCRGYVSKLVLLAQKD